MKKPVLGRGLGALISDANNMPFNRPATSESAPSLVSIAEIPIDKIDANPFQPRSSFDEESLKELADSILNLGLIQPITVRLIDGHRFQIISGERRYRAALLAGLVNIPAYIRKADDQGMLEMAIVENIQRENLDSIEIALSFQRLIEECNLTQEAMAERVGKKRTTITNYLRLLKLPLEIQLALRAKALTMGHARALLALDSSKKQLKLCNQIIEQDLSVRQVEEKIKKMSGTDLSKKSVEPTQELDDSYFRLLEIFGKYFNNNVSLKKGENGIGSITIHFKEDAEVLNFLKALEQKNI